jgi:sugar lactone lactonase YvrE
MGSEGIGAGKFTQANSLALDMDGYLYVGDYVGNRVQVFEPAGKFVVQWNLDPTLHIRHLVAGLSGELYANLSGRIFRYDRKTGQRTGEVQYTDPADGDIDNFDNMAVALDGSLLASWINNTLETDTLLRFNPSGKLLQTIPNPIQEQTGQWEPHIYLAIDGLGNIYALGENNNTVCEYSQQGKLITRFGSKGSKPGQFDYAENIAIDSRGRLYIGQFDKVQVFDATGLYLDSFEVDGGAYVMVFDRLDNLFVLGTQQVNKYVLRDQ